MKILYIDTETTGLDPRECAIIQISGIIEIDGIVKEEFDFFIKPHPGATISDEALEITGKTLLELENYPEPHIILNKLLIIFDKYIDKYDKTDKFIFCGYNCQFDKDFLINFFKRLGNDYLFSYIGNMLDILQSVIFFRVSQTIPKLDNAKLSTLCKYFDIEIDAHTAISDIRATRNLYLKLLEFIKK